MQGTMFASNDKMIKSGLVGTVDLQKALALISGSAPSSVTQAGHYPKMSWRQ